MITPINLDMAAPALQDLIHASKAAAKKTQKKTKSLVLALNNQNDADKT
jgi:hypothetical protein